MGTVMLLSTLVDSADPERVYNEVEYLLSEVSDSLDLKQIHQIYNDLIKLYDGNFAGYRQCTTKFHDLRHVTDVVLTSVRLMHAVYVDGRHFTDQQLTSFLIASIFHDSGYIQAEKDREGTGAKFMLRIADRSMAFVAHYFTQNKLENSLLPIIESMIKCTGSDVDTTKIKFHSLEVELLGKILGSADLLGAMADRTYIEKLPYLYEEYQEGESEKFDDEFDLLTQTTEFHTKTREKFSKQFSGVNKLMIKHFEARWNINEDLYETAITNNITYLEQMIKQHGKDYKDHLHRGGALDDNKDKDKDSE